MINHIIDNIFVGDWQDAKYAYERREFDEIFTVAKDSPFIGNHYFPLVDGPYPDNEGVLWYAIDNLDFCVGYHNKKLRILVHCISGFSRSTSVIAGYMNRYGYTVEDALYHIKKIRPLANPVPELVKLLEKYERNK